MEFTKRHGLEAPKEIRQYLIPSEKIELKELISAGNCNNLINHCQRYLLYYTIIYV